MYRDLYDILSISDSFSVSIVPAGQVKFYLFSLSLLFLDSLSYAFINHTLTTLNFLRKNLNPSTFLSFYVSIISSPLLNFLLFLLLRNFNSFRFVP